jgi:hypothetical protein
MREFSREGQICPDSGRNLSLKLEATDHFIDALGTKVREPCTMQHTTITKINGKNCAILFCISKQIAETTMLYLGFLKKETL